MQTVISESEIKAQLQSLQDITVGSFIRASFTDKTIVGVNVSAPSSIRKQAFTLPFMKNYCESKGWTLTDRYPRTHSMQIYFN